MQSSLYSNVATRQPCSPCSSNSTAVRQAAPCIAPARPLPARQQPWRSLQLSGAHCTQPQRSRGSWAVGLKALQQQHGTSGSSDQEPVQHQHQQQIPPPEWHPRLFGLKDSKRAALEHSARLYYTEVWGAGSVDLLDEIADAGVCFNDALGMEADAFSRASLKAIIQEFKGSHPLLTYELEDVLVDEVANKVVVQYTVTAAHLLPQADGSEATGHVSVVSGMDKIHFTRSGLISSILSFRQRFMEEEAEPINWDAV